MSHPQYISLAMFIMAELKCKIYEICRRDLTAIKEAGWTTHMQL